MNSNEAQAVESIRMGVLSNLLLAGIKFFSGWFGNSYALIADAIESFTDVLASIMLWVGIRFAHKPPDANHPYGHGKIEPLLTFVVVGFLITSATIIAIESIENIRTPHTSPSVWTLFVLGGIILIKEATYRYVLYKSKKLHSVLLKADAWHHRSDAITSLAAFVGISVSLILGPGYEAADDWAALASSVFILYNSYLIFRPALGEILDEDVYSDLMEDIKRVASEVPGIHHTEKCIIRKTGMRYHVDLHARVDGTLTVREGHALSHRLKDALHRALPQLGHISIHIEPI